MKRIKKLFVALTFTLFIAAPVVTVAVAPTTYAAPDPSCDVTILGIPPWYQGLASRDKTLQCNIDYPTGDQASLSKFIWRIVLNVIQIGLFIVGYLAVFFVLYGGFQFLTGGSNPAQIEKARKTILNAVVGLVISIAAVVLVNLLFEVTK